MFPSFSGLKMLSGMCRSVGEPQRNFGSRGYHVGFSTVKMGSEKTLYLGMVTPKHEVDEQLISNDGPNTKMVTPENLGKPQGSFPVSLGDFTTSVAKSSGGQ